jgi:hypothetical protein
VDFHRVLVDRLDVKRLMCRRRLESRGTLTQAQLRPESDEAPEAVCSVNFQIFAGRGCATVSQNPDNGI